MAVPPKRKTADLDPREAAVRLAVSDGTVRRWVSEGRLPGVRVGGRYRIDAAAVYAIVRPADPGGTA